MTTTETFTGFRPEAIQFLADLAENNDRAWFTPRKGEYERLLKAPARGVCASRSTSVSGREASRSRPTRQVPVPHLPRRPLHQGQVAVQDQRRRRRSVGRWRPDGPGRRERHPAATSTWQPGEVYVGGGMWHPEPAKLAAFRAAVADDARARPAALDDPALRGDVRRGRRRQAEARAAGLPAGSSARPSCSSTRTSRSGAGWRTTTSCRPSCRTSWPPFAVAVPVFRMLGSLPG